MSKKTTMYPFQRFCAFPEKENMVIRRRTCKSRPNKYAVVRFKHNWVYPTIELFSSNDAFEALAYAMNN